MAEVDLGNQNNKDTKKGTPKKSNNFREKAKAFGNTKKGQGSVVLGILLIGLAIMAMGWNKIRESSQTPSANKLVYLQNRIGGVNELQKDEKPLNPRYNLEYVSTLDGVFGAPYFSYVVWIKDNNAATYDSFRESAERMMDKEVNLLVIPRADFSGTVDKRTEELPEDGNIFLVFTGGSKGTRAHLKTYVSQEKDFQGMEEYVTKEQQNKNFSGR